MKEDNLIKLKKACQMITEVIFEYKDDWEKQYKWVSFLLHGQGAIKNAISEFEKDKWEVKKPLLGER
jgi:hypothetical protein